MSVKITPLLSENWIECKFNNNYEIYNQFPYTLRHKASKRINTGYIDKNGNRFYRLKNKPVNQLLVIATQFIPNPNNYKDVELIDKNKPDDYSVENIRWK